MRWELEPDPYMAIERGDVVGGHYSADRLERALSGYPIPCDNAAFAALQAGYAEVGLATVEV